MEKQRILTAGEGLSLDRLEWTPGDLIALKPLQLAPMLITEIKGLAEGFDPKGIRLNFHSDYEKETDPWTLYPKGNVLAIHDVDEREDEVYPRFSIYKNNERKTQWAYWKGKHQFLKESKASIWINDGPFPITKWTNIISSVYSGKDAIVQVLKETPRMEPYAEAIEQNRFKLSRNFSEWFRGTPHIQFAGA